MEYFRGDIVFVEKSKYIGKECGGDRPAVIVSNNSGNHFSDCVEIVYLTTAKKKDLPTHVEVKCHVLATALCEQIYTVSKERITQYIRSCTAEEMQKIDDALMVSLGLDKKTPSVSENETAVKFEPIINVKELEAKNKCLQQDCDELNKRCKEQKETIGAMETNGIALMTERDIYKKLYEDLLEKVTG